MERHSRKSRRKAPAAGLSRLAPIVAGVLLTSSLATAPALAQQDELPGATEPEGAPEEMAREGVELLLRALRGFLDSVPQYGLPRIEENGDIVIPRLNRGAEDEENEEDGGDGETPDDPPEETRT